MKRTKRHTIRRIALGLAVAAVVPATAQARPMDVSGSDLRAQHAAALGDSNVGIGVSKAPDDRAFSRQSSPVDFWNYDPQTGAKIANSSPGVAPAELANLSHSVGGSGSSDDRSFSKATSVGAPSVSAAGDGSGIDVGTGTASGIILLLAAAGAGLVVHQSRKAKLSPA